MIRVGEYYYKNLWSFIKIEIFRRPNIKCKGFKPYYPPKNTEYKDILKERNRLLAVKIKRRDHGK